MNNLPIRRPIRPHREHERIWNGRLVDKNLENEWLESLNSLKFYKLISICEGHNNNSLHTHPHINLRLKEEHIPVLLSKFDQLSQSLNNKLVEIFGHENNSVTLEFKIKLIASPTSRPIRRDLVIRIRSRHTRENLEIDNKIKNWFQNIIIQIQKFDKYSKLLYHKK